MSLAPSRTCNALECLFVGCNVRFAAALRLPEPCGVEQAGRALARAVAPPGRGTVEVELAGSEGEDPSLRLETSRTPAPRTAAWLSDAGEEGLSKALAEEVAGAAPAHGHPSLVVLVAPGDQEEAGKCRGVVVNANHAVCDGHTMKGWVKDFVQALSAEGGEEAAEPSEQQGAAGLTPHWGDMLPNCEPEAGAAPFLEMPGPCLALKDIASLHQPGAQEGQDDIRVSVPGDVARAARDAAKAHGATVTGVLVACWQRALADAHFDGGDAGSPCVIGVSVLVDMRPHLTTDQPVVQAIGTVTTGAALSPTADLDSAARRDALMDLAARATSDIRQRVDRGEANRQAKCLADGRFDEGAPQATVELSNLGIFDVPEGAEVLLSQRFDGYDGLSCLAHSEGSSGALRLAAGAGEGLCREAVAATLAKVEGNLRLLAEAAAS